MAYPATRKYGEHEYILGCDNCGALAEVGKTVCDRCHSKQFVLLQKCTCGKFVDVAYFPTHIAHEHDAPETFEHDAPETFEHDAPETFEHDAPETFECDFCGRQRTRYHCDCFPLA